MLCYGQKLLPIIDNLNMAMEIFNHNFAIDCPGVLNGMICFAEASLSGQIGPELSQVFVYIDICQGFI